MAGSTQTPQEKIKPPGSDLSQTQLGGKLLAEERGVFQLVFKVKLMFVVVPGSGPWVMLPDENLLSGPLGADGSHFSQHGLLLCLLCA